MPFKITPLHWWGWLNPFFWRRKYILEKVLVYQWGKDNLDQKIKETIEQAVLYGTGYLNVKF